MLSDAWRGGEGGREKRGRGGRFPFARLPQSEITMIRFIGRCPSECISGRGPTLKPSSSSGQTSILLHGCTVVAHPNVTDAFSFAAFGRLVFCSACRTYTHTYTHVGLTPATNRESDCEMPCTTQGNALWCEYNGVPDQIRFSNDPTHLDRVQTRVISLCGLGRR
jgi:hypothetical protein